MPAFLAGDDSFAQRFRREARAVAQLPDLVAVSPVYETDPVGDVLDAIRNACDAARGRGGHLCVVASVCGTDEDGQGLKRQKAALTEAGVLVFPSAAQAAGFCREAALTLAGRKEAAHVGPA